MMTLYRQPSCVFDGWETIHIVAFNYDGKGSALTVCNGKELVGFGAHDLDLVMFGCLDDNPDRRYYDLKPRRKRKS